MIGVVLAGIAIGNWLGGKIAERTRLIGDGLHHAGEIARGARLLASLNLKDYPERATDLEAPIVSGMVVDLQRASVRQ